jgi:hypothetical protein
MDGTGNHHTNPDWERQISHVLSCMQNQDLKENEWHKYKNDGGREIVWGWEPLGGRRVLEDEGGMNVIEVLHMHVWNETY